MQTNGIKKSKFVNQMFFSLTSESPFFSFLHIPTGQCILLLELCFLHVRVS